MYVCMYMCVYVCVCVCMCVCMCVYVWYGMVWNGMECNVMYECIVM